jgi:predicted O-methyltransferase YrrM
MPSRTKKIALWSRLLLKDPTECLDRLTTVVETKKEAGRFRVPLYHVQSFIQNVESLGNVLGFDLMPFLQETGVEEIKSETMHRLRQFSSRDSLDQKHNADPKLASICYALCRALKPKNVIETGVAYGITTAFILKAMHVNGIGHLYSVDLPPLAPNANESTGRAVPDCLRSRWTLCRGKSSRILPTLLRQVETIDIFIHDSLHTYQNELFEFETAWPFLRGSGVLVSDDIEEHPAWLDWESRAKPVVSVVFEEQKSAQKNLSREELVPKFGIMVKG